MNKVDVKVKKLHPEAKVPSYAKEGDVGLDIYSNESVIIGPGERYTVGTGISMSFPVGFACLVWDRSGNAHKKGITTLGGVIDPGYRGEYKIIMLNTSDSPHTVEKGDRIAQALIQPVFSANFEEVSDLDDSDRGQGGFGSTGR